MAEKTDIIRKLDQEIEGFIESGKAQSADLRIKKLEYYTALQNGIDIMPLNPPQIDALARCDKLLETADRVYDFHAGKDETQPDYTALCFWYVDDVYQTERMKLLRYKTARDMTEYKNSLMKLPPEKIMDSAYEFTMKNELYLLVDAGELPARQVDTLLTYEHPLEELYAEWLDCDLSFDDVLRDSIQLAVEKQEDYLKWQNLLNHNGTPSEDISVWNAMYEGDDMRVPDDNAEETAEDLEQ